MKNIPFRQTLKKRGKEAGREFLGELQNQVGRGQKRKRTGETTRKAKRKRATPPQKGINRVPTE